MIAILIPVYNPNQDEINNLTAIARSLEGRERLYIIDSSQKRWDDLVDFGDRVKIERIEKSLFRHGRTRNHLAALAQKDGAETLLFMTQDAVPMNPRSLEYLVKPILLNEAVATFARQVPRRKASLLESFSRYFNYPAQSRMRTRADIPEMGVKAFFFSNVCSAVRADVFRELGGFPDNVIMNEDMLMAAKVLRAGHAIKYVAEAEVVHSHDYSLKQQFRRNFDVGAFFADAGGMLEGAAVGGEGFRFVREQLRYVLRRGRPDLLPLVVLEAGAKFSAFQLGKRHRFLPLSVKKRMSMHSYHWDQK